MASPVPSEPVASGSGSKVPLSNGEANQRAMEKLQADRLALERRIRADFDRIMAHKDPKETRCKLTISRPKRSRHRMAIEDCKLDCTFDFRRHLAAISHLPDHQPPPDRYRIKSLEGGYRLRAQFALSVAQQHLDTLQRPPVELVARYTEQTHATHAVFRKIVRDVLTGTLGSVAHMNVLLERVEFESLADKYQRPFLFVEAAMKRFFTPVYNLLSNAPQKWRDGTLQDRWQKDIARVYDNVTSGALYSRIGQAVVNGPGAVLGMLAERLRARTDEESKKA